MWGGRKDCLNGETYKPPHPPFQKTEVVLSAWLVKSAGVKVNMKLVESFRPSKEENFFDAEKLVVGKSYRITSVNVRSNFSAPKKDGRKVTLNPQHSTLNTQP